MRIAAMLLADAANETADRKVNLLGVGFTTWPRQAFPARAEVVVFLRVEILSSDAGGHSVALDLINADGRPVIPRMQGQFTAPPGPPMYRFLNLIYNLRFEIPGPGEYSFRAIIDNREDSHSPVTAVLLPNNPTEQSPGN